MSTRRRLLSVVAVAGAMLCSASCASHAALSADRRIRITQPGAGDRLALPVRLTWTAHDVAIVPPGSQRHGAFFGVFIDRPPLKPGQNLLALVEAVCANQRTSSSSGSANNSYFAQRNVYLTDKTSVVLNGLPEHQLHRVAIVLIDEGGSRIGETVATTTFRTKAT